MEFSTCMVRLSLTYNGKALNGSMRDTDRDRSSFIVVKNDSGINSLDDLRGKTIGFGDDRLTSS